MTQSDGDRTLIAVFASPVAEHLLHFGRHLGFRTVLVDPEPPTEAPWAGRVTAALEPSFVDSTADVVVTDHDRPELGAVLRDALALPARWIGVMGSVRHTAPHLVALRALAVAEPDIARVHRPVGLDIAPPTPADTAGATLAGLHAA